MLADFHHASLLNSLRILFEDRYEGELYRPIGREWFDNGYWKVYDHPATVAQYLEVGGATPDNTQPLNEVEKTYYRDTIYLCKDIDSNMTNKAITYQGFMSMHFDLVIASLPQHIEPFRKLVNSHPAAPKLIYQIGNAWNITPEQESMVDGIISSAKTDYGGSKPYVEYHQEFGIYDFTEIKKQRKITSFVNCFSGDLMFADDFQLFEKVEKLIPNVQMKVYGGQCRDGCMHGSKEVAREMQESMFIWHTKKGGDGYGHIIHNAFAYGVPPIVKAQYYDGKLARELMVDGETCIIIDNLSAPEIVNKINYFLDFERLRLLSDGASSRFNKIVDWNKEADDIAEMLKRVLHEDY